MRVQRLKRLLLFGPYIMFLITLILCGVLCFFLIKQQEQIGALEEEIEHLTVNQNGLIEKVSSIDSSMDDLGNAVGAISTELSLVDIGAYAGASPNASPASTWPRKVYLTFDDGPSANTEKIFDSLDHYGVKGNFFVVGTDNADLREMYKRIVDEGHVLCMHSYTHKYNEIYSSVDAFTKDLDKISELLYDVTGTKP